MISTTNLQNLETSSKREDEHFTYIDTYIVRVQSISDDGELQQHNMISRHVASFF